MGTRKKTIGMRLEGYSHQEYQKRSVRPYHGMKLRSKHAGDAMG